MSTAAPAAVTPDDETARIADRVYSLLRSYTRTTDLGWVFPSGTAFRCGPGTAAEPDAAFASFARSPAAVYSPDGTCEAVPDLVVEVVAPDDLADPHMAKLLAWKDAGVRLLWEVYPNTRNVYVWRRDGTGERLQVGDTLTADDVLPGFACPVADLFRLPGEATTGGRPA